MNAHKKPTVFISYSHTDSHFVDNLAKRLKVIGVDIWIDKWMIKVGDSITGKINEGIGASDYLIIVLSRSSVKSKWVREELNTALVKNVEVEKGAFILPVLKEDCEIPSLLQHRKYANFKDDPELGFQALIEVISPHKDFEPEMILIPSGEFLMGSDPEKDKDAYDNEQPQHRVYVSGFYISKYPITDLEYRSFLKSTGYGAPFGFDKNLHEQERENHPVINVSWNNAVAFCVWLSKETGKQFRLPTEAEWEKTARGTDGRIYPWGNDWDPAKCNSGEGGFGNTRPVGKYSPEGDSPYGAADMAGNVYEWCADFYDSEAYKSRSGMMVKDPRGPDEGDVRVLRGGSWSGNQRFARCACRRRLISVNFYGDIGFRVVVSLADSES
jgi:formylglycine-generating enzyme required for sulfatase activity